MGSNSVSQYCHSRYQQVIDRCSGSEGCTVVASHFGEFSQELVNGICTEVENTMLEAGDKKSVVKRMFSILVEALQNIRLHGERDEEGKQLSYLVVTLHEEAYHVDLGNLLVNKVSGEVSKRLAELNELDEAEVKQLYMDVLTNGIMSSKGGAGLGFITIAMKSKNPLDFHIEPVSDALDSFNMEVKLNRKKS